MVDLNSRCRILRHPDGSPNKEGTHKGAFFVWWAIRDSNPGPTGYEPVALTN